RHVALGGHRIPFLIAGETGVFVLWAVDRGPGWDDLAYVNDAAALIKLLLPGYRGDVQPGLCRAFQPTNPRWWYRPGSTGGAWVLGVNSLQHWLAHFGTQHGLSPADLRRLNQLAGPHWQRRSTGRSLPPTPNVG